MKWLSALPLLLASYVCSAAALDGYSVPPGSPGFQRGNSTQAIQFDSHSLFIGGNRTFIMSGEFHPWRLPVPQLWSDVLQKMKAAGFNTVSIYVNWGLIEGKPGSLNWDGYRSIELFYQVAQQVGMYVISRPGPYINAETTGGGFPGWLTNMEAAARTNQTGFVDAWQEYIAQFANMTSKYQYPDGPVIAVQAENEFRTSFPAGNPAMVLVRDALQAGGIDRVPITHNDYGPYGNFASGPGRVDIYGFDGYPGGFDCSNPTRMVELPSNFVSGQAAAAPWSFMYLGEFQGGSFDGWQGAGYDKCEALIGPEFSNVFYKANIGFGTTALSLYMTYGGTNWGNLAYPGVYTSYDYGAAIRESRILAPKYGEIKLQAHFYQASPSLLTAKRLAAKAGAPMSSNAGVYVTNLGRTENPTNYYVVRQISNNFTTPISTSLTVSTSSGPLTIPQFGGQITLAGRESKILVTEYPFGKSTLKYSTAEVMTQATIGDQDFIVLYVPLGQSVEVVVPSTSSPTVTGSSTIKAESRDGSIVITGKPQGVSLVTFGNAVVVVADKAAAMTFWNPRTTSSADLSPSMPSVLISGPYLVRNATISGSKLNLVGDTNGTTTLNVFAPEEVTSVTWNGALLKTSKSELGMGLSSVLPEVLTTVTLPDLKRAQWKAADSLPEAAPDFDDSSWVVADKTTTSRPFKPYSGKMVLYADEYGFHSGNFVFRGYFDGPATGIKLSVQGGSGFGFSAFLNGRFIGSGQGASGADISNKTFTFPSGAVSSNRNVLTVVQDSTGISQDWNANEEFKNPRGIRGYEILGGSDISMWKLTGNIGGEDFPDTVRGPLNEGGLWAERTGATLPEFDDSKWSSHSPFTGISKAGIHVYRTKFNLDLPSGVDAPLALKFTATPKSNYRSVLYVNGWQFGRFVSNFGPQTVFPIPEGILNHNGQNELVMTLWSLDAEGAKVANLELTSLGIFASGKEAITGVTVQSPTFSQVRQE